MRENAIIIIIYPFALVTIKLWNIKTYVLDCWIKFMRETWLWYKYYTYFTGLGRYMILFTIFGVFYGLWGMREAYGLDFFIISYLFLFDSKKKLIFHTAKTFNSRDISKRNLHFNRIMFEHYNTVVFTLARKRLNVRKFENGKALFMSIKAYYYSSITLI